MTDLEHAIALSTTREHAMLVKGMYEAKLRQYHEKIRSCAGRMKAQLDNIHVNANVHCKNFLTAANARVPYIVNFEQLRAEMDMAEKDVAAALVVLSGLYEHIAANGWNEPEEIDQ